MTEEIEEYFTGTQITSETVSTLVHQFVMDKFGKIDKSVPQMILID